MTIIRTTADDLRDEHRKLMLWLDRAHDNMHKQLPAPTSDNYGDIAADLEDAARCARKIQTILEERDL